jgi:hypothetical protein
MIFMCTWVAVHLNILQLTADSHSNINMFLYQVKLMAMAPDCARVGYHMGYAEMFSCTQDSKAECVLFVAVMPS